MSVLVTGGFGYIGAHIVRSLEARGEEVVVVDDLSTGVARRVQGATALNLDIANDADAVQEMAEFMLDHRVASVIHMAAKKQVAESVAKPAWYYHQNVGGLARVLMAMERGSVPVLVYSSSAAVYGDTSGSAIHEGAPTLPVNPYGASKLVGEHMVRSACAAQGVRAASLRYFNVAGAAAPELGDIYALNLVPMVFERLAAGEPPRVFGDDYDTPDGTCVRDFVHVSDLADAHVRVLEMLDTVPTGDYSVYNVGTGRGYSVLDVVESIQRVTGTRINPVVDARRPGDPASVIASSVRLRVDADWESKFELDDMTRSAWEAWQYQYAPGGGGSRT